MLNSCFAERVLCWSFLLYLVLFSLHMDLLLEFGCCLSSGIIAQKYRWMIYSLPRVESACCDGFLFRQPRPGSQSLPNSIPFFFIKDVRKWDVLKFIEEITQINWHLFWLLIFLLFFFMIWAIEAPYFIHQFWTGLQDAIVRWKLLTWLQMYPRFWNLA